MHRPYDYVNHFNAWPLVFDHPNLHDFFIWVTMNSDQADLVTYNSSSKEANRCNLFALCEGDDDISRLVRKDYLCWENLTRVLPTLTVPKKYPQDLSMLSLRSSTKTKGKIWPKKNVYIKKVLNTFLVTLINCIFALKMISFTTRH